METQLHYEFVPTEERPHKYVLPHNPNDAYNQHSPEMRSILQKTEKCPFPQIRELIILFHQSNVTNSDIELPDLLREKYYLKPEYEIEDTQMNQALCFAEDALVKLQKMDQCTDQYIALFKKLRSGLNEQYQPRMQKLRREVEDNKQKAERMKGGDNRRPRFEENEGGDPNGKKNEVMDERLEIYRKNQQLYDMTNKDVLQIENNYFKFTAYSRELERALLIGGASQAVFEDGEGVQDRKIDSINILKSDIQKQISYLKKQIEQGTNELFKWRKSVKNSLITERNIKDLKDRREKVMGQLSRVNNIFLEGSKVTEILKIDRNSTREVFIKTTRAYQEFLPGYIEAREVNEIYAKKSIYLEIIKNEKMLLQKHLQDNFGLIVPYSTTQQFQTAIKPMQDSDKQYLKHLFLKELTPLEEGIHYVNEDYSKLYKEACSRSSRARREIQTLMEKFKQYQKTEQGEPNYDNGFVVLLEESCRKLMWMLKQ